MNAIASITARELSESPETFIREDWKIQGLKITAIHGRDKSTKEKYDSIPDGHILVSVIEKKPGYSTGIQKMIAVSPDEIATA